MVFNYNLEFLISNFLISSTAYCIMETFNQPKQTHAFEK